MKVILVQRLGKDMVEVLLSHISYSSIHLGEHASVKHPPSAIYFYHTLQ